VARKNRPSVKKREREQAKRQREQRKAERAAQKRERRFNRDEPGAIPRPDPTGAGEPPGA